MVFAKHGVPVPLSLYRLPGGQDKPRVREWVHLAVTYNGETGKCRSMLMAN
jgi:hypothetical protein